MPSSQCSKGKISRCLLFNILLHFAVDDIACAFHSSQPHLFFATSRTHIGGRGPSNLALVLRVSYLRPIAAGTSRMTSSFLIDTKLTQASTIVSNPRMLAWEQSNKRRRLDSSVDHDLVEGAESVSPLTSSTLDRFSQDPAYLASQEELRALLLLTAQSTAPSRRGSSAGLDNRGDDVPSATSASEPVEHIGHILADRRRVEYWKNYVGRVAPWVSQNLQVKCV